MLTDVYCVFRDSNERYEGNKRGFDAITVDSLWERIRMYIYIYMCVHFLPTPVINGGKASDRYVTSNY